MVAVGEHAADGGEDDYGEGGDDDARPASEGLAGLEIVAERLWQGTRH